MGRKNLLYLGGQRRPLALKQSNVRKAGLFEKDLVIEVTGQEGRRFWGMQTLSGNGEKTEEPFFGELTGKENREVIMADTDGYAKGEIGGDVFSFCYAQAGGKSSSSVVSCTEVKRAR